MLEIEKCNKYPLANWEARQAEANVTLKKVQEIADALDIDDYAILFEKAPSE
ncbi:hypothetical protein [Enterococcus sp. DIV0421]|uniref:hypothetical protein n=1 Tax=Enterococcus sp. DIV0421 TaxID=2774688 RepID=UPI003F685DFB